MISAIDNNKNQYYEKVGAVNFRASRGYSPEFIQELQSKTNAQDSFIRQDNQRIERTFGSLLTYGRGNSKNANPFAQNENSEYNLNHPNVKNQYQGNAFDFIA